MLLIHLIDAWSIPCEKVLGYIVCWLCCVVLLSITVPKYDIMEGATFAHVSDYTLDNRLVFAV